MITHLNICAREERSLRLSIVLPPASICSNRNSYGEAIMIEHMAKDMQLVKNAVLSSVNRHSVIGRMANGTMNML